MQLNVSKGSSRIISRISNENNVTIIEAFIIKLT
jgi:hypothetical protein